MTAFYLPTYSRCRSFPTSLSSALLYPPILYHSVPPFTPLPHSSLVICANVFSPSYCLVFMRQLTHTETGSLRRRGEVLKALPCLSKSLSFTSFCVPLLLFFFTHTQLYYSSHDSAVPVMNALIHSYVTNVQTVVIQ